MAKKSRKSKSILSVLSAKISLEKTPFHVLLSAVYPLIFLYMINVKEMDPVLLVKPLCISVICAVALFFAVLFMVRDMLKAGFISTTVIVWFFSYGQLYRFLNTNIKLQDHYVLFPLMLLLTAFIIFFIVNKRLKNASNYETANLLLNYMFAVLVAYVAITAVVTKPEKAGMEPAAMLSAGAASAPSGQEKYPDIYYIILDGHTRYDYMKKTFNYDETDFISKLRAMGFYVADKARANYPETLLSFASFLNGDYLDKLVKLDAASDDRVVMKDLIRKKGSIDYLKQKGYTLIMFPSVNVTNALKSGADFIMQPSVINFGEFEYIIFSTSVISAIDGFFHNGEPPAYRARRQSVLYDFRYIPEAAKMSSPKIVFAHILCPHPPFVFDGNGGDVLNTAPIDFADGDHSGIPVDEYVVKYGPQARFVDDMTLQMVGELMKNMKKNSIIIIHGDHGSGSHLNWEDYSRTDFGERLSILSAYYLPDGGEKYLRPGISPVNNFRIIQKAYFGEKTGLLPDRSYFSKWSKPYDFIDVTKYTQ
jgi:hypothetical protein